MDRLEDRLRRGLAADADESVAAALIESVHAGARRRRARRMAALAAASVAVVGVAVAISAQQLGDGDVRPAPQPPTSHPTGDASQLPDGATTGVIGVAVANDSDIFRLTTNVGCVGCSTVWWLDPAAGSWTRLHDFGESAYQGGRYDPTFGPVEYLSFADNGLDGWAWGRNLHSTHDGGRTWTQIEYGPGSETDYGHWTHLTRDRAWSLHRSEEFGSQLFWTPIDQDDWSTAHVEGISQAHHLFTTDARVILEAIEHDFGSPYLLSSTDAESWTRLDLPCSGENNAYRARTAVFVLCPSEGGATVYRTTDFESWQEFGSSDLPEVKTVMPVADDRVVLIGQGSDLVISREGAVPIDLGLDRGERIWEGSWDSAGSTTYAATSRHRLLVSSDLGLTWQEAQ